MTQFPQSSPFVRIATRVALGAVRAQRLTVRQTATGYWVVQRGAVSLAGAVTREAAEAERELLERLRDRGPRRAHVSGRAHEPADRTSAP
jgi:hypothetical protein